MVANIRRSGPPADRRKELASKQRHSNPEDFDESDDIALANQNYDNEDDGNNQDEEEEEQEVLGMVFIISPFSNAFLPHSYTKEVTVLKRRDLYCWLKVLRTRL
jgi:hypothetical protein